MVIFSRIRSIFFMGAPPFAVSAHPPRLRRREYCNSRASIYRVLNDSKQTGAAVCGRAEFGKLSVNGMPLWRFWTVLPPGPGIRAGDRTYSMRSAFMGEIDAAR